MNPCKARYVMKQRKLLIRSGQNGNESQKEVGRIHSTLNTKTYLAKRKPKKGAVTLGLMLL
ncbi:hypothetical protein [Vibrio anguillarum]|uniref:hypothetical protein n=1 Tax=Vibrio anguillarum TaxID=55601 RepID=UPI0011856A36|nr:hypothetical protein [Vibrio anguillarum]EGQ7992907.1 hypothetical protein [Vibrio vulnificus]EGQ9330321.1 hypothetical protein [Vibrio vulnificus]MBF4231607.1 hypothetical protein [Vibrio anguillarum]MBF4347794.1 hypothetical protein [Vibrio anguillarum]MBT2912229.1 hypothetical protein [Vibrio anguillarum]